MHNLSGSFWCSKVCLWSLEGCAFLKRAVFLSSYLSAQFPGFTYDFSYGTVPPFDKGERAGGTEVLTSLCPLLLPSLILIPDHSQHPLCTHHLSSPPHPEQYYLSAPDTRPGTSLICAPADVPGGSKGKLCRLIVIPWSSLTFLEYFESLQAYLQVKCLLSIINSHGWYSVTCSLARNKLLGFVFLKEMVWRKCHWVHL